MVVVVVVACARSVCVCVSQATWRPGTSVLGMQLHAHREATALAPLTLTYAPTLTAFPLCVVRAIWVRWRAACGGRTAST